jgi:hypothetical protein
MTSHGVRLTEHGKRRGVEVSWSSLIALIDTEGREVDTGQTAGGTGVPEAISKDVAREIRSAAAALARADDAFRNAGVLPLEILADVASDPFHGRANRTRLVHRTPPYTEGAFINSSIAIANSSEFAHRVRADRQRDPVSAISGPCVSDRAGTSGWSGVGRQFSDLIVIDGTRAPHPSTSEALQVVLQQGVIGDRDVALIGADLATCASGGDVPRAPDRILSARRS